MRRDGFLEFCCFSCLFKYGNYNGLRGGSKPCIRDIEGTPKNLCDKDFVELLAELSSAICLKPLFCWVMTSTCSEISLVLFVRFLGFGVPFWPLNIRTPIDSIG